MAKQGQKLNHFLGWLAVATVWFFLDRISKTLIVATYQNWEYTPITNFFNIVRVHNTGAAFSFLANHSGWQLWFLSTLALVVSGVILYLLYRHGSQWLFCLSLTGIMGGALGNSADRAIYGYVIDFLDFHWQGWHYPAFNVADICICLGVIGIILDEILRARKTKK